jgi:hypothetical protein
MKDYRKELTDQEREQKIEQATAAYSKFMDVIQILKKHLTVVQKCI